MYQFIFICMIVFNIMSCSTESRLETPRTLLSAETPSATKQKNKLFGPPETGEPAMHAIHNNRLQQVMQQINLLVYAELSNELGQERQIKTQEVARIARELASSQKSIMETMPALKLKPTEEYAFVVLAEKLRLGAVQLEELANQNKLSKIPPTLETLTNTCTSCHVLFRKKRSLLEQCKDPGFTC